MLRRLEIIEKRISNVKKLSNELFEKTLQWNLYKTYSTLWDMRINLIDVLNPKNYQ